MNTPNITWRRRNTEAIDIKGLGHIKGVWLVILSYKISSRK